MKLKYLLIILFLLIFSLKFCAAWEIVYDVNNTWEIVADVATNDEITYAVGIASEPLEVFLLQYEKGKSFKVFKLPLKSAWDDVTILSRVSLLENDAIISVPIAPEKYSEEGVYTVVARISKDGKVKWAKIIPKTICLALIVHNNNIYLSCSLHKEWKEFGVLLKLSPNGTLIWAKSTEDLHTIFGISKNLFFVGIGNGVLFGKLLEDGTVLYSYRVISLKKNESFSDAWPFIAEGKNKVMVGYNVNILNESNYIVGSASYLIFMNKDGSISEIKRIKPKQDVGEFYLLDAEENVIIGDIERELDVIDGLIIDINDSFRAFKIPNVLFIAIENGVIGGSSNEDFLIANIEDLMEGSTEEDVFVQDASINIEKVELKFVKTYIGLRDYDLSLKLIYEKVYEKEEKEIPVEKPEIEEPIKKPKTKLLNILIIFILILAIFILTLMIYILKRKSSQIPT